MVVAKKNVSFMLFTDRENLLLRILNVFGYADKKLMIDLIGEDSNERALRFRRMSMKKLKIIDEFMTGFPIGYEPKEKETYYCLALGENGIGYCANFPEGKQNKRVAESWEPRLHHDFILARVAMEICISLQQSGFEIEKLYNDSGNFNEITRLQPDGTIIFSTNTENVKFGAIFIEVERHYLEQEAVARKLSRYATAIHEEKFDKAVGFDLSQVRVVYVSTTINKFNNGIEKIKTVGYKGYDLLCIEYHDLMEKHVDALYTYPFTGQKVKITERIPKEIDSNHG